MTDETTNIDRGGDANRQRLRAESQILLMKNALDLALEYHKQTSAYAINATRMSLVINSGAILALFAFVKDTIDKNIPIYYGHIALAALIFSVGLLFALLASMTGYLGHHKGTFRAVYDAIQNSVRRDGVTGELRRFFREADKSIAMSQIKAKRETTEKWAEGLRLLAIAAIIGSFLCFLAGVILTFFELSRAVNHLRNDNAPFYRISFDNTFSPGFERSMSLNVASVQMGRRLHLVRQIPIA